MRTDQLIDEIVYEQYGLTEEEIEIVEEAVGEWRLHPRANAMSERPFFGFAERNEATVSESLRSPDRLLRQR